MIMSLITLTLRLLLLLLHHHLMELMLLLLLLHHHLHHLLHHTCVSYWRGGRSGCHVRRGHSEETGKLIFELRLLCRRVPFVGASPAGACLGLLQIRSDHFLHLQLRAFHFRYCLVSVV
jgi:hypothetical protein